MKLAIAAVVFSLAATAPVMALDFSKHSTPSGLQYILASGNIEHGDSEKLLILIDDDTSGERILALNSPGGALWEAVSIGRSLRYFGYSTFILPDGECFSACFFAFIGGEKRFVYQGGRLGVHQFYGGPESDSLQSDSQYMTGELFRFTREMEVSSETVEIASHTKPDEMYVFSGDELERFALSIKHKHVPFWKRESARLQLSGDEYLARWRAYVHSSEKASCYAGASDTLSREICLYAVRSRFGVGR